MNNTPTLHIALPAMNEADFLPATMKCLVQQTTRDMIIWVCVNQPDCWWGIPEKLHICNNNQQTINYLEGLSIPGLRIMDCSSPGKGWKGKNTGVGQARKYIMDAINTEANPYDIIVSLDADTVFGQHYLESIKQVFFDNPNSIGLSNPYYHNLSGTDNLDRAMLRYEIYMRHYAINMWAIGSPYSYTALGSAIALPVSSYRKIGGMTPKKSGEDFYLLQKLRKTGYLINYNPQCVYPGTRFSDRVFFGTGPAMIKGSQGDWGSYPIYDLRFFQDVKTTYDLFPSLYLNSISTPMSGFLTEQFGCDDIFDALRVNSRTQSQFVKACHHRIDGLRVLQYLKSSQDAIEYKDEENLRTFFEHFFNSQTEEFSINLALCKKYLEDTQIPLNPENSTDLLSNILDNGCERSRFMQTLGSLDFENSPIDTLNFIRTLQCDIERIYQIMDLAYAQK